MRTRASFWIFATATTFLLVAVVTREARFLALMLPLLAFGALASLFSPPAPEVEVRRTTEKEALYEGEEIEVRISLRNTGEPLPFLEVYDALPHRSVLTRGTNHLLLALDRDETKRLEYRIQFPLKGRYPVGPVVLRSRDSLGVYLKERRVPSDEAFVVAPRIEDLRKVSVLPRRTRPRLGQVPSRIPGLGTEFWSIREYHAGDDLRRVNWKASARLDSLLTNERESERSGDVILVLDAREAANVGFYASNAVELGIRALASLASRLLHDRNRVGLVVQRDVMDWVTPGFGRRQLYRIIDTLIGVRPGGQAPFEQIGWMLKRHLPTKALLVIISPLVDRSVTETIAELRASGFDIILLSPSSLEVDRLTIGEDRYENLAYRLLRMQRDGNVGYLRRFAHVVDWNPDEPLTLALKEVSLWSRYQP
ncbi:MAG: DUF58 domain-containing protein [Thermoplasmata archaeon]